MRSRPIAMTEHLDSYIQSVAIREPEVFRRCRLDTAELPNGQMQITPAQGQFLAFLVELIGAKRVLELGTFTGYSTLWLASALEAKGCVVACDSSEQWTQMARRYWDEANLSHKIQLHVAPAIELLQKLLNRGDDSTFDLIFIDADKMNLDHYYEHALRLLRPGGMMAIDNVLWAGKVADTQVMDLDTQAIRALNNKIYHDTRVSFSLLPIGDGLTLVRKRTKPHYISHYH